MKIKCPRCKKEAEINYMVKGDNIEGITIDYVCKCKAPITAFISLLNDKKINVKVTTPDYIG
jgi:sarcosine oxidase delta subunit